MVKRWKNHQWMFYMGNKWMIWDALFWILGFFYGILVFAGEVTNTTIFISYTSRYLLAVVAALLSIPNYICWLVVVYLDSKCSKKLLKIDKYAS